MEHVSIIYCKMERSVWNFFLILSNLTALAIHFNREARFRTHLTRFLNLLILGTKDENQSLLNFSLICTRLPVKWFLSIFLLHCQCNYSPPVYGFPLPSDMHQVSFFLSSIAVGFASILGVPGPFSVNLQSPSLLASWATGYPSLL